MALFSDDAGKTEKPTPQRLGEARDRGQTPLSRELVMAGTLLVAVLVLEACGHWLIAAFRSLLADGMTLRREALDSDDPREVVSLLHDAFAEVLPPFCFLLAVALGATLLFGYGQIGVKIATKAFGWKLERLNPVLNLQRVLSFSSVVRTLLSVAKLGILGGVLYLVLRAKWAVFAHMHEIEDLSVSIGAIVDMAFSVFFWVALVVLLMSIADIAWQRYRHTKSLMMSKQEVDDERKRTEGDPLIKGRLRAARLALMRHRMMEAVPKADVVITNPTHYAVALRYERGRGSAPEVVAKGVDELALRIREIAVEHDVPMMEDPPLARALFRAVKVGQQIPERFYKAVATVLSHVYRLEGRVA
jgi:flagellar biosynthetic protein FlhB